MPWNYKKLAMSMAVGAVFSGLLFTNSNAITIVNQYQEDTDHTVQAYVLSPLDLWINRLVKVESDGKAHIKIMDVNDRYSYGCLQFQMYTFEAYGQKYGFLSDEMTQKQLEEAIFDCRLQKRIAKAMIQDNPENWKHWYNSVVYNVGRPPKSVLSIAKD